MGPLFEKRFDPTPTSGLNSALNDDSESVRGVGSNCVSENEKKVVPRQLPRLCWGTVWLFTSLLVAFSREFKFSLFTPLCINDKLYFYLICPKTGEHPWCKFAAVTSPTAAATTRTTRLPRRRRRSVNVVVSLFHCSDVELNCFTVPTKLGSLFRVNSSSPRKFM